MPSQAYTPGPGVAGVPGGSQEPPAGAFQVLQKPAMPFTFQAHGPRGPELAEMNSSEHEIAEPLTVGAEGTHQASCGSLLYSLPSCLSDDSVSGRGCICLLKPPEGTGGVWFLLSGESAEGVGARRGEDLSGWVNSLQVFFGASTGSQERLCGGGCRACCPRPTCSSLHAPSAAWPPGLSAAVAESAGLAGRAASGRGPPPLCRSSRASAGRWALRAQFPRTQLKGQVPRPPVCSGVCTSEQGPWGQGVWVAWPTPAHVSFNS